MAVHQHTGSRTVPGQQASQAVKVMGEPNPPPDLPTASATVAPPPGQAPIPSPATSLPRRVDEQQPPFRDLRVRLAGVIFGERDLATILLLRGSVSPRSGVANGGAQFFRAHLRVCVTFCAGCTDETFKECVDDCVFGLPLVHFKYIQHVCAG